jgi:hypothetical protein
LRFGDAKCKDAKRQKAGGGGMDPATGTGTQPPSNTDPPEGVPYESASVLGAVLLTIFIPIIALIAALMLRGSQRDPARRRQLGTWAVASGAFLMVSILIGIMIVSSLSSSPNTDPNGPCQGGPKSGVAGEPVGGGNYRFPCEFGGSTIVKFP